MRGSAAVVDVAVALALATVGCSPESRIGTLSGPPGPQQDGGAADQNGGGAGRDASVGGPDLARDFSAWEAGTGAYGDLSGGGDDGGTCVPPRTPPVSCPSPLSTTAGCGPVEICGNGLDDNCDGQVDEGCSCVVGAVQRCFLGPPGKHNVGACTDGTQTCMQVAELLTAWAPCTGSIGPKAETCDRLDNDCNGCADDGLCCGQVVDCPAPGDPRIAPQAPYTDVALKGEQFFTGNAATWSWTITGGPCDQLFSTTTGSPPAQSFTLTNANGQDATVHYTLSGDYTVTLTVTDTNNQTFTCTWVQHVIGPGVRFELCWDTTGPNGSDIDLHVHSPASMSNFFSVKAGGDDSADDCDYRNCKASSFLSTPPSWGYGNSPLAECVGGPEGALWMGVGFCRNPRLDIDNVIDLGKPENANIDAPKNGDTFRALVHYFGTNGSGTVVAHPLVNVYCAGTLKATYGQAPNVVTGFTKSGGWAKGDMWRVADVTATVNSAGVTTDCTVDAIHPPGTTSGYLVGHDGKISFTGM